VRIVHVGPFKLGTSCGHFNALWSLACAQASRGHDVTIVRVGKQPTAADAATAAAAGVRLVSFPCPRFRGCWTDRSGLFDELLDELRPGIAHLFYVRVPKFAYVARALRRRGVPYVVSLHGGMNSIECTRKRYRKLVYWHVLEKEVHANAAGLHFVSEGERDDYRSTRGVVRPADAVIPNIVETPPDAPAWRGLLRRGGVVRLAYLGRYDVWTKGLDLALALLRALAVGGIDAELHLHGSAGGSDSAVRRLLRRNPDVRVFDQGYVGAPEKFSRLAEHDLYLQYSRFESFGMSLAEAMALGLPPLVSRGSALAATLGRVGAAVEIPMEPAAAATVVARALENPAALAEVGRRAKAWVRSHCGPATVVVQMEELYERALAV
jgi:glycosyltransferase involved in cell wall biosynthesis